MIELKHTDMATDEDKAYGIDTWARLFKATTWEEIKMITEKNPSMESTAESIFLSNSDLVIMKQCRDREDYYREKEYTENLLAQQKQQLEEKDATIAEKDNTIAEKDTAIAEKDKTIAEKDKIIAELRAKLDEKDKK